MYHIFHCLLAMNPINYDMQRFEVAPLLFSDCIYYLASTTFSEDGKFNLKYKINYEQTGPEDNQFYSKIENIFIHNLIKQQDV